MQKLARTFTGDQKRCSFKFDEKKKVWTPKLLDKYSKNSRRKKRVLGEKLSFIGCRLI